MAPPPGVPVLGRNFLTGCPSCQQGFGEVRPDIINFGGDPMSVASNVRWRTWGGSHALAVGDADWVTGQESVAEGSFVPATIVAFNLGKCGGRLAYTALEWYFPEHGDHFDPNSYTNICTGDYVGTN
jgi:hypothetical protein